MDLEIKSTLFSANGRKSRSRKRGILKSLQSQVEFYFGDANLQHDRFLMKKIKKSKDGFVPVDFVANFKRMQELTDDLSMIIKAIQNSSLLQMNETSTMVKRIHPLESNTADTRTVYVERLPHDVDHEWLRSVFSCCGDIEYISLPRYRNSGDAKGFAFIEYTSEADAEKACQVLNSIYTRGNNTFGTDILHSPADTSFNLQRGVKRSRSLSSSYSDVEHKDDGCQEFQTPAKRKKIFNGSSDYQDLGIKTHMEGSAGCLERKHDESKKSINMKPGLKTVEKRRRKRKKKVKEHSEVEIPPLYVIHKKEWMRLKALYKSLQKECGTKLKIASQRILSQ